MTTITSRTAEITAVTFREVPTRHRVRTVTVVTLAGGEVVETIPGGKCYVSPTMIGKAWKLFERDGFLVDVDYA